jgi:amino acid transporter
MAGLLAAGGMASALGLFVANLLSVSRLPKAMSDDGCLPSVLRKVDRRRGTPYVSIIACATVVSGMVLWRFDELLIIDVVLYGCALFLEFLALISLRRRQPGMDRPFRIPLSPGGLVAMTCLPALCFLAGIAALAANESIHTNALVFALASLCTAPLAWLAVRKRETGGAPE